MTHKKEGFCRIHEGSYLFDKIDKRVYFINYFIGREKLGPFMDGGLVKTAAQPQTGTYGERWQSAATTPLWEKAS
jgi:hypothetical protein